MQLRSHHWQGIASLLVTSALALTGCGSVPLSTPPVADASSSRQSVPAPAGKRLPALPPAGSGRGGYYKDDGPGDEPPDGLHDLPDAVPKVEPYSTRGNRPYVVFGKTYTPFTDDRPFRQRGRGSWYGKKFHGQKTSSGELYDMYKMTAAHPTLPIPSYARVTNVGNGNQVIVRVNDRGPFHANRIIDLSYTAALKLDYISMGSAELEVERLLPDEIARINSNRQNATGSSQESAPGSAVPLAAASEITAVAMPEVSVVTRELPATVSQPGQTATAVMAQPVVVAATTSGFYLQLGAYGQAANAEAVRGLLAQTWSAALPPLEVVQNGSLYRVYSGPFASRSDADSAAQQVQAAGGAKPVIVQR